MNSTETAGSTLVKLLNEGLPSGVVWDASERAVLGLIEQSADRVALLRTLIDAELAKPEVSSHSVCDLAAEIRLVQAAIVKMIAGLDPRMEVQAKSTRHVAAANARWHPGGA